MFIIDIELSTNVTYCWTESVTYTLWCQECGDEVASYKGETGRNAYSRGVEHLDCLEANDEEKSVLWLHSIHHHQSRRDVKYSMKVTGAFQDPLDRRRSKFKTSKGRFL